MTTQPTRSYTRPALAIVLAGVVVGAALFASPYFAPATTVYLTSTSTMTTTETTTSTTILTLTSTIITSTSTLTQAQLLAACSHTGDSAWFPKLVVSTNATALLCVRAYYYDSNETYTINATNALDIEALQYSPSVKAFSGASNFTMLESPSELVIGGPNSTNEGAVIAFALTAKPGASGSYELNFNSVSYVINVNEPEQCGSYGEIVAGDGEPSYLFTGFNGCITYATNVTTNSTKYTVIDNEGLINGNDVLINGNVYFQIVGATNSTQMGNVG